MSANKSNELIQRASHDLDPIQLKLLNKIIEMIDSDAKEFKSFYHINLGTFIKEDLKYKDNKNFYNVYKKLKEMINISFEIISEEIKELSSEQKKLVFSLLASKKLSIQEIIEITETPAYQVINSLKTLDLSKKIKKEISVLEKEITIPGDAIKTTETYSGWFSGVERVSTSDIVTIEIPKMMARFYLGLKDKGNYASVNAKLVYKLKSKYSIRLYELITSHSHKRKKIKKKNKEKIIYEDYIEIFISYKKLKTLLNISTKNYKDYRNFRRYVLETAKRELIKKDTDIQFDFEASGRGDDKDIIFKIYNVKKEREKEEAKRKQELINNSDNIDKQIYTDIETTLEKMGFNEKERNKLISEHDEMKLRRNINYTLEADKNKKVKTHIKAFLRSALKADYAMNSYEQKQEYQKDKVKNAPSPLPIVNQEPQKEKLKTNNALYQEFIKFIAEIARNKPSGRASVILPNLISDSSSIDTIPFIDKFIDKFFKLRN